MDMKPSNLSSFLRSSNSDDPKLILGDQKFNFPRISQILKITAGIGTGAPPKRGVPHKEPGFERFVSMADYPENLSRKYSRSVILEPLSNFSGFLPESEPVYKKTR